MQTWIYLAFLAFSAAFSASRFARLAEVCIGLALKLRCRNDRKNMTAKNHQGLHATERKEEKKKNNKAPREAVRVSHCRRGGRTTAPKKKTKKKRHSCEEHRVGIACVGVGYWGYLGYWGYWVLGG